MAVLMQGAVPMGEHGWERVRILAGRPAADSELTELYNPLEAGLYHAVSVTKARRCFASSTISLAACQAHHGAERSSRSETVPGCRAATLGRRRCQR